MLTVRMLAARWHISERAVYELIASGALRHVRLGRLVRVPEEALLEIESQGVSRMVGPRARRPQEGAPAIPCG
jgi:excisionase family DNA binding protein